MESLSNYVQSNKGLECSLGSVWDGTESVCLRMWRPYAPIGAKSSDDDDDDDDDDIWLTIYLPCPWKLTWFNSPNLWKLHLSLMVSSK